MAQSHNAWVSLLLRGIIGVPALVLGWHLLDSSRGDGGSMLVVGATTGQIALGVCSIVVCAISMAPPVARLLAEPLGSFFYPSSGPAKRRPIYVNALAKRKRGKFEQAIKEYDRIAARFPNELRPYVDMIDIAIMDLNDENRAAMVLRKGLARLKRDKDKGALVQVYRAYVASPGGGSAVKSTLRKNAANPRSTNAVPFGVQHGQYGGRR